jgi:hypothetical protein
MHYRIGTEYLGQFSDGAVPPENAVECPAPTHALQEWNGSGWVNGSAMLDKEREDMVCSRFQAKAALLAAGLLGAAEDAVASSSAAVQLAWAEAVEFRRTSPTIVSLASSIGLSETEVDHLFREAMQIEA